MIEEMIELQNRLNIQTNGEEWARGVNKHNKKICWERAIYMECAELVDSLEWKWWKDVKKLPDWNNIEVEIVDIWHFLLSALISEMGKKEAREAIEKSYHLASKCKKDDKQLLYHTENVIKFAVSIIDGEHLKEIGLSTLLKEFFLMCKNAGLSFERLYRLYIGKNALNKLRQDFGYDQGNYQKYWLDTEDNEWMRSVSIGIKDPSFEQIYNKLLEIYTNTEITKEEIERYFNSQRVCG